MVRQQSALFREPEPRHAAVVASAAKIIVILVLVVLIFVSQLRSSLDPHAPAVTALSEDSSAEAYKAAKEAWVTGHSGSSPLEIVLLSLLSPVCELFRSCVAAALARAGVTLHRQRGPGLVLDVACAVVPGLLALTVASGGVLPLLLTLLAAAILLVPREGSLSDRVATLFTPHPAGLKSLQSTKKKAFVTHFRVALLVSTCIAILAVDFAVFPRRFAKTESAGFSVMDLGVGSFVLSNAMVSRLARQRHDSRRPLPPVPSSILIRAARAARGAWPLLLLGAARLFTTKASDYQQHVSEYGVHWNFFVTLFVVAVVVAAFNCPAAYSAWAGAALLVVHEAALLLGLSEYVRTAPRDASLIAANREGLVSLWGYVAIALMGTQLGHVLLRRRTTPQWTALPGRLLLLDACLWVLALFVHAFVDGASRRTCNMAYVLWVMAHQLLILIGLLVVEMVVEPQPCVIADVVGRSQLAVFLLANLLTGAVNLGMRTLVVPAPYAMAVLGAYIAVVIAVPYAWERLGWTLKFW